MPWLLAARPVLRPPDSAGHRHADARALDPRQPVIAQAQRRAGESVFDHPLGKPQGAYAGCERQTGMHDALMTQQQGHPPQDTVAVPLAIDEAAEARLVGDGSDAAQGPTRLGQPERVQRAREANARRQAAQLRRWQAEKEEARTDGARLAHDIAEIAVVVLQLRRNPGEIQFHAEVVLEAPLQRLKRCPIRLAEQHIDGDGRRLRLGDAGEQLRYAVAWPGPLPQRGKAGLIDADYLDGLGVFIVGRKPAELIVEDTIEVLQRRQLQQGAQTEGQR